MKKQFHFTLPSLTGKSRKERKQLVDTAREQLTEWLITNATLAFIQSLDKTFKKYPEVSTVEFGFQDGHPNLSVVRTNNERHTEAEDYLIKATQDFPDLLLLGQNCVGGVKLQRGNLFSQPDWKTFVGGEERFQHLQEMFLQEIAAEEVAVRPQPKRKI